MVPGIFLTVKNFIKIMSTYSIDQFTRTFLSNITKMRAKEFPVASQPAVSLRHCK